MTNIEGEIPRGEVMVPHELTEEQLGNLVSAVSSEPKSLLIALMGRDEIYAENELYNLLLRSQGENPGWKIGKPVPFAYCKSSLEPIGLVAGEVVDGEKGTIGYMKTEHGNTTGTALAGLLLQLSEKHEISLYNIFGSTSSSSKSMEVTIEGGLTVDFKKRAPTTRIKLFRAMLENELPMRRKDLALIVDEDEDLVGAHLRNLAANGIIEYDSIPSSSVYGEDTPFEWRTKSIINLADEQRDVLEGLMDIISGIKNLDKGVLNEGLRVASLIAVDPIRVSSLMARAKETSPHGNSHRLIETKRNIRLILTESEDATVAEITQQLSKVYGENLGEQRIRGVMRELRSEGQIIGRKDGSFIRWSIAS